MVGVTVPLSAICDIRDRAATILRQQGYLAAVRVPVQTIENGDIRLEILAARLTGLQVRGDAGPSERVLARYLSKLQDQPLFNVHEAERYLLLAGDIPGLDARLTLRPGDAAGEVIGEVTVLRTPAMLDINLQNYGARSAGRWGGLIRLRANGLTGLGDETSVGVYSVSDLREQQVVQAGHQFRVGGEGLTVSTDITYAWSRPALPGNVPIRSRTLIWSSEARYPLQLRQGRSIWATGGFDWVDQDVELATLPLSRDHLRVGFLRLDGNFSHASAYSGRGRFGPATPRWAAGFSLEARQGLAMLGASAPCGPTGAACFGPLAIPISRAEADPSALVLRAQGEFQYRPVPGLALFVQPRAQYAASPLLTYEEFSAGSFTVGRGYDPGSITGDSGVGITVEARVDAPVRNRRIGLQPFVFIDGAWAWNEDTGFAGLDPQRLYSAGGGVRVTLANRARLDLTLTEPLRATGIPPFQPGTRILASLTVQFGLGR
jgi:hemolysin activation/secretion protein